LAGALKRALAAEKVAHNVTRDRLRAAEATIARIEREAREDFDKSAAALGDTAQLQPGVSPLGHITAWRRAQLGR
jgi:hypothetical protein